MPPSTPPPATSPSGCAGTSVACATIATGRPGRRARAAGATLSARSYVLAPEPDEPDRGADPADPDTPVIVAEMTTEIATLTVSEAVMRMDLADLPALLFRNGGHGRLNLVYRRRDGNIGWVDPDLADAGAKTTREG